MIELAVTDVVATTEVTDLFLNVEATVANPGEITEATVELFAIVEGETSETAAKTTTATIEEGTVKASFEKVEDGTYKVVVTVGEVSQTEEVNVTVDFAAAIKFVEDVNAAAEATNTIELNELLSNEPLIVGYNVEDVADIAKAIADENTVVVTINDINEIIKGLADTATEAAFKAELVEAAKLNNVKFAEYLSSYENVEATDEYVNAYRAALVDAAQAKNAEEVQAIINEVNADKATAAAATAATEAVEALTDIDENDATVLAADVDQAQIDAAKALVEALEGTTEDASADEYNEVKANLLADITEAQQLLDVAVAIEEATVAVVALTTGEGEDLALAEGIGQEQITAAQELVEALADGEAKTALQEAVAAAQVLQDTINLEEATAAVAALTEEVEGVSILVEGTDQAVIDAAQALVDLLAEDVATDLQAKLDAAQTLLDTANYEAAVAAATEAVDALTVTTGEGEEAVTTLAEGVEQAQIDAAQQLITAVADDAGDVKTKTELQAKLDAAQELLDVASINNAIANGSVAALQEIIVGLESETFGDLSKAQREELGAYIIKVAKEADPVVVYTSTEEFIGAIDGSDGEAGFVESYLADIVAFNTAANVELTAAPTQAQKLAVIEAIEAVTTLEGFTAVTELDLAEFILESQPVSVKTIAEIEAFVTAFVEANK